MGVSGIPVDGNTRIRGGSDAELGEFPYIISIRRIANAFKHMCAGVLVDPQWVLTSAFCVSEVGTYSIDAVGGEHNLVIPSVHEQIRGVDLILQHPNYTPSDASVGGMATPESNDVALVRLKSPMTETDFVKAVTLAERSPSSGECITAGWGTKTVTSLLMTSVLQMSVNRLTLLAITALTSLKKLFAPEERTLPRVLVTCGEMLGDLWFAMES